MVSHPDSARTRPDPDSNERYVDPVIEAYKKDVDRTLIREMLKLTPEERLLTLQRAVEDAVELRTAMSAAVARAGR